MSLKEKFSKLIFTVYSWEESIKVYEKIFEYADYDKADEYAKKIKDQWMHFGMLNTVNEDEKISCRKLMGKIRKHLNGCEFQLLHICCPECKKVSKMYEWFTPVAGWDEMLKKYAHRFLGEIAYETEDGLYDDFINSGKTRLISFQYPQERILCSVERQENLLISREKRKKTPYPNVDVFNSIGKIPKDEFELDEKGAIIMRCPCCGKKIETESCCPGYLADKEANYREIIKSTSWMVDNAFDRSYKIYADDDKPFVTLSIFCSHFYPNTNGKMHVAEGLKRVTFNTETGMTYVFGEIDKKTRKPIPINRDGLCAQRISNMTYGCLTYLYIEDKDMLQETADAICKKLCIERIDVSDLKTTVGHFLNLTLLARINRFGSYGKDTLISILRMEKSKIIGKKQMTEIMKMKDQDYFVKMVKKKGVKGKKRIKIYAKNPAMLYLENLAKELGFKDNNILLQLISDENMREQLCSFYINPSKVHAKEFVCEYSSIKSEAEIYKKIVAGGIYSFNKISAISDKYYKLKKHLSFNESNKKMLFTGTLDEIKYRISELLEIAKERNFYIPYTEKEMKYNCKIGEFTFSLVRKGSDLTEAGTKFHNCVGGYKNRALSKSTNIVIMKKGDEFSACIEVSPYNALLQVKDVCNKALMDRDKIAAVKRFIKEIGLTINTNDFSVKMYNDTEEAKDFEILHDYDGYYVVEDTKNAVLKPESGEIIFEGISFKIIN